MFEAFEAHKIRRHPWSYFSENRHGSNLAGTVSIPHWREKCEKRVSRVRVLSCPLPRWIWLYETYQSGLDSAQDSQLLTGRRSFIDGHRKLNSFRSSIIPPQYCHGSESFSSEDSEKVPFMLDRSARFDTLCRKSRRRVQLLQKLQALTWLQIRFHSIFWSIRTRKDASCWASGTQDFHLFNFLVMCCIEMALSIRGQRLTMGCRSDLLSWMSHFGLLYVSISIKLLCMFLTAPSTICRIAGTDLLSTLCKESNIHKCFNPFHLQ